MTDAELIYNACLRAERRLEEAVEGARTKDADPTGLLIGTLILRGITALREEIGRGISDAYPR